MKEEEKSQLLGNDSYQSKPLIPTEDSAAFTMEKTANEITVDLVSPAPTVIFYGPSQIGKSVALIRLCRYLKTQEFIIEPDTQFRKDDKRYLDICKTFDEKYMDNDKKPESTTAINFLLIKVKDRQGRGNLCQLLEAPGEHFFDMESIESMNKDYPPYFYKIINDNKIPKIYIFFLELDWETSSLRKKYEDKIVKFRSNLGRNDSVIVLVNKADKHTNMIYGQQPLEREFKSSTKHQYPAIYKTFLESRWFAAENYRSDFMVFSAGNFNNESMLFTESSENYPQQLWNKIQRRLRGGWLG